MASATFNAILSEKKKIKKEYISVLYHNMYPVIDISF